MKPIPSQPIHAAVSMRNRPLANPVKALTGSVIVCRLVILFLLLLGNVSQSAAQGAISWSKQERIPEYYDQTEEPPYMVADRNFVVHVFNAQPLDLTNPAAPKAIFYRDWTIENGWGYPNDILFDPDGFGYNLVGVTSDTTDRVHLIIQKNGALMYVQNYLALVQDAGSWPTPIYLAGDITVLGPGFEIVSAIATDPTGNEIVIIYSGRQYGNGLYFTSSSDGGNSWTDPYPIYLTGDELMRVTDTKLYFGESGVVHAVWSTFLSSGFGGPGYYANFSLETKSWSDPIELDTPGIRTPSVVETQGTVFVSYHHINVNGNWWRKSIDGGKTWSFPEQFSARHVGTNGGVSFVVDSANVLHAFFGERMNDQNHGMWHIKYTNGIWSGIEAVVRGPQVRDVTGGQGFDPRSARAVIVNGNVVLVSWGTDGFAGTNGAWYSYKRLDAPALQSVVLEAPTIVPPSTPTLEASSKASATAVNADLDFNTEPPAFTQNPQTSILAGVIPALLLLVGTVVLYYVVQSRSK